MKCKFPAVLTFALLSLVPFARSYGQLSVGVTTSFYITYDNTGGTAWTQAEYIDTLPAGLTYVSCSGAPCQMVSDMIVWDLGTVPAGESIAVSFQVYPNGCYTASVTQQALLQYGSPPTDVDSNVLVSTIDCYTYTPTATGTPTMTPTFTLTPTATWTPTITDTPTVTFTPTLTYTPTITFTPTVTFTPTITFTPTNTGTPTNTFTPTATHTPICSVLAWPDPYQPACAVGGFFNLSCVPEGGTVAFYTVSGEFVGRVPGYGGAAQWNGRNELGGKASTGVYFYVVENAGAVPTASGKFLLMR